MGAMGSTLLRRFGQYYIYMFKNGFGMYPGSFAPQILQALKDSIDAKAGGVNERTSRIRGVVFWVPFWYPTGGGFGWPPSSSSRLSVGLRY